MPGNSFKPTPLRNAVKPRHQTIMAKPSLTGFFVAFVLSAIVWAASPLITGQIEAWDSQGYYFTALAAAGFLSGFIAPRPIWAHYAGTYAGQLIYALIFLEAGPLFLAGAVLLLGYSLIFALAAWIGGRIRRAATGKTG